jgi:hypothetical protein
VAFVHGSRGQVLLNGTDISAYCNSIDFPVTVDNADTTVLGLTWRTNLSGLRSAEMSLDGFYDPTASTGPAALMRAQIAGTVVGTLIYRPAGSVAGQYSHTMLGNITGYGESNGLDDAVAFSAAFVSSGTVVSGTL